MHSEMYPYQEHNTIIPNPESIKYSIARLYFVSNMSATKQQK